ncbi:MAG: hypothetical protein ABWY93_16295 [Mycobacterium sp.]
MKKLVLAAAVAGAMFGLAAGTAAQAVAAPSGIGSAQDTVNSLESSGYRVVVKKVGVEPLELCTVDSIRPGSTAGVPASQVVQQPVYLTANC